ncbi:MAG: YhdP family protein [Rubrivivax sp.]
MPSSRPALPNPDRRRHHALRTTIRWAARLILAAWGFVLLAWLVLHWVILPRLDEWRPQIEARAGAAIGAPVRIGAIRVRSGSWIPAFEADDVRLLDRDGQVALQLGRVSAALAPRSLLTLRPRFAQLHLEGVRLDLRRDRDGSVRIGAFDLDGPAAARVDSRLADWFFAQSEFVVRHGSVRWTDATRDAPSLELADVDFVLRNGLRQHALRVDATPPAGWGERFTLRASFTQPLTARAGDWRRWNGRVFADLPGVDAAELRRHVALPFVLEAGHGALRAWVDVERGRPVGGTADLALADVTLRLGPQATFSTPTVAPASTPTHATTHAPAGAAADLPLRLRTLSGRLTVQRQPSSWDAALTGLAFITDDGEPWQPSSLRVVLQQAAPAADGSTAPVTGGSLRADRLELGPLARLAARLPLPPAAHLALAELLPQGSVNGLDIDWRGPPDAPLGYRVRGRAQGLALAAGPPGPPAHGADRSPGRPGLRGATVELDASDAGGTATLSIRQGLLIVPGVFEQAEVPLHRFDASLAWTVRSAGDGLPPAIELNVRDARFANADGRGSFTGRWQTGSATGPTGPAGAADPSGPSGPSGRYPGRLELTGTLQQGQAARVARYLPVVLSESARRYVERAMGNGQLADGRFEVSGDLAHFPFIDGSPGRFLIRSRLRQLQFAVVPPPAGGGTPTWPALSSVGGELEFDRGAMRIRVAEAQWGGFTLRDVHGGIEDLVHQPVLRLDGQGRGSAADLLRFVDATPVGRWIGGSLQHASASGDVDLTLSLALPLHDTAATTVRGALQLGGNELRLAPGTPALADARGRVDFTEKGFSVVGARARVFGGDATLDGGSQPDGSLRFAGQGLATTEGLLRAGELPALAPLAALGPRRFSGQAPYQVQVSLPRGGHLPEWQVTSSLAGLAIDLPSPLGKPAAAAWPLRVSTSALAERTDADEWRVELGDVLQLRLERDLGGDGARVRRGSIGIGIGAALPPLPSAGVVAALQVPRLDVDAWQALADAASGGAASAGARGSFAGADAAWPTQLSLRSDELRWGERRLHGLTLALQRRPAATETHWVGELQADEAAGRIEWHQPRDGAPGRVVARLDRLNVPAPADRAAPAAAPAAAAASAAASSTASARRPVTLPALDLRVQDFRWRGKALGRLEARASNRPLAARTAPTAPAQEWQIEQLRLTSPDAILDARGRWIDGQRTALDLVLDVGDAGRFAERIGAGNGLSGGRGRIEGRLGWQGSPLAPDASQLEGDLKITLADGRFLNADPGAARLLGVLSLQALPRRLLLDFRDVFQEGFGFDTVSGDVTLDGGVARTTNLRLLGVQAAVLIEGRTDLHSETQDLHIIAVPEINAGTAALAVAAINPAVGLGTFLAQWLLREPMMAASTREFRVTGTWSEPSVERVDRLVADTAAGAARSPTRPGGTP